MSLTSKRHTIVAVGLAGIVGFGAVAPSLAAGTTGPRNTNRPSFRPPVALNSSGQAKYRSAALFDRTVHAEIDVMTRRAAPTPPTTAPATTTPPTTTPAAAALDDGDSAPSDSAPLRSAHVVLDRGSVTSVTPGSGTASVVLHRADGVDVTVQIATPVAPPTTTPAPAGAVAGAIVGGGMDLPANVPPEVRARIMAIYSEAAGKVADLLRPYVGGGSTPALPAVGDEVVAYNLDNAATSKLAPASSKRGMWALFRAYHGMVIRADDGTTPDQPPTDPANPPATTPAAFRTYLFDRGTVSAVGADSVTIARPDSTSITFGVAAETKYVLFRPRPSLGGLADVKVGDRAATVLADTGATYVLDFGSGNRPPVTTVPPTTAPPVTDPPTTVPAAALMNPFTAMLSQLLSSGRR